MFRFRGVFLCESVKIEIHVLFSYSAQLEAILLIPVFSNDILLFGFITVDCESLDSLFEAWKQGLLRRAKIIPMQMDKLFLFAFIVEDGKN